MSASSATRRFRIVLAIFIAGLVLSGITAFPLRTEMRLLVEWVGLGEAFNAVGHTGWRYWLLTVLAGLEEMHGKHPWMAYGTDWLAFGHIVIAFFFVGPLIRPAGSRSVLYAGIAACIAVIPTAFICGAIRGIPVYWRLIDCSFGVIGVIPLLYCLHLLRRIESAHPQT